MIKRYDIASDSLVEVTQADWDELEQRIETLAKFAITPPEQRRAAHNQFYSEKEFDCKLRTYPNPVISKDLVFVAEDRGIEPYKDISGLDGKPMYPTVPQKGLFFPHAIACNLAEEIVKRWNAYEPK